MRDSKKILWKTIAILTIAFSVSLLNAAVVTVGEKDINANDIKIRCKMNGLQKGVDKRSETALFQLLRGECDAYLAKEFNMDLTEKAVHQESLRIDKNTHTKELLEKIKECAPNRKMYEKIFVAPEFAHRWLFTYYRWQRKIHKKTAKQAESVLADAIKKNLSFEQIAEKHNLKSSKLKISKKEGIQPEKPLEEKKDDEKKGGKIIDMSQAPPENVRKSYQKQMDTKASGDAVEIIDKVLVNLKPGEIHPRVIEMATQFWILKYISTKDKIWEVEVVTVPKEDFFAWRDCETRKIPIKVHNRATWTKMKKAYPKASEVFIDEEKNKNK